MRTPPSDREGGRQRRPTERLCDAVARLFGREAPSTDAAGTADRNDWELDRSRRSETQWRRSDERVDCFRFDDGYVATVTYEDRETTWQLTPGPVQLGSALATVALYLQHDITPQFDRAGRLFIAVDGDTPIHVFEEIADRPVEYDYLDGTRTVEEFPPYIDVTSELERVFERMSPAKQTPRGE